MVDEAYVSATAWIRRAGRADHVDEIADQFERPVPPATEPAGAMAEQDTHWPKTSLGWRTLPRVQRRAVGRRAG
jgi:hypothetical protein